MVSAEHRGCLLPESSLQAACIITSSILHGIIEKNTDVPRADAMLATFDV
jgi:hypothetical protein